MSNALKKAFGHSSPVGKASVYPRFNTRFHKNPDGFVSKFVTLKKPSKLLTVLTAYHFYSAILAYANLNW